MSSYSRIYTTNTFRAVRRAIIGSSFFEPVHYASSHPCYSRRARKKAIRKIPVGNADKRKWVSHLSTNRLRKSLILGNRFTCSLWASISLCIPKMFSPVRGCQFIGWSLAFIGIPPCVAVLKRICALKNKGRTDKTLRVFLQHKNKVYLFARSLKVRGFVLFSPPALGSLCGLSQYGFCQF